VVSDCGIDEVNEGDIFSGVDKISAEIKLFLSASLSIVRKEL